MVMPVVPGASLEWCGGNQLGERICYGGCGGICEVLMLFFGHGQWRQQQLSLSMLARRFQKTRIIKQLCLTAMLVSIYMSNNSR